MHQGRKIYHSRRLREKYILCVRGSIYYFTVRSPQNEFSRPIWKSRNTILNVLHCLTFSILQSLYGMQKFILLHEKKKKKKKNEVPSDFIVLRGAHMHAHAQTISKCSLS